MVAPVSAKTLALGLPNSSVPIAEKDSGLPHKAWLYFFAGTAQRSSAIDANFTQSISATPTQAEVQALSDQIALLSQQLGKTPTP